MELAVVKADDTLMEAAAIMARLRSPLCAVIEGKRIIGVLTASHLLELVCGDDRG
jgi:CBS domain-containing protein